MKVKFSPLLLIFFVINPFYTSLYADSSEYIEGRELHDKHCLGCHDTSVYNRHESKIKDYESLLKQVKACEHMAELVWFDEEIEAAARYVNHYFYQFPH